MFVFHFFIILCLVASKAVCYLLNGESMVVRSQHKPATNDQRLQTVNIEAVERQDTTRPLEVSTKPIQTTQSMKTSPSLVQVKRPDVPGLPECAPQQVCNAMFLRLNHTQHLCNCPLSFPNPCPVSQSQEDGHTLNLVSDKKGQVLTLVKICDPILTIKTCDAQQDWMLLALQSMRTGKAHYLVICQCPSSGELTGPISHENPPYADIPGIRVFGMICTQGERSAGRFGKAYPDVPWDRIINFMNTTVWHSEL